jgi:hypothetical protein
MITFYGQDLSGSGSRRSVQDYIVAEVATGNEQLDLHLRQLVLYGVIIRNDEDVHGLTVGGNVVRQDCSCWSKSRA